MDEETNVTDAEIVEDNSGISQDGFAALGEQPLDKAVETNQAQTLVNLEELIRNTLSAIERDEIEARKFKESLDDIFLNDATYQEHLKIVNEAKKVLGNTRKQLMKLPAAADVANKYKDAKGMIKERRDSLAEYIAEYQRMSGASSIEDSDGIVRDIILVSKLVKRSAKK